MNRYEKLFNIGHNEVLATAAPKFIELLKKI